MTLISSQKFNFNKDETENRLRFPDLAESALTFSIAVGTSTYKVIVSWNTWLNSPAVSIYTANNAPIALNMPLSPRLSNILKVNYFPTTITDNSSLVASYTGDGISMFPDNVAGRTYWQDDWATTDGWDASTFGSVSTSNGLLVDVLTGTVVFLRRAFTSFSGKLIRIKLKTSGAGSIGLNGTVNGVQNTVIIPATSRNVGEWFYLDCYIPGEVTFLYIGGSLLSGSTIYVDTIYIGSGLFNDPVPDRAGNNNATNYGVLSTIVNNRKALQFLGAQYIQCINPIIGTSGHVYIRFSLTDLGRDHILLTNAIAATAFYGWTVVVTSSNSLRFWNGGTEAFQQVVIKSIPDLNIHTLVIGMDSSNIYYSVDNAPIVTVPITVTPAQSTLPLTMGRNVTPSGYSKALIYDISYDSSSFTQEDVSNYNLYGSAMFENIAIGSETTNESTSLVSPNYLADKQFKGYALFWEPESSQFGFYSA